MNSFKVPSHTCTKCFETFDAMSHIVTEETSKPKKEDFTICINCGHIMELREDFILKEIDATYLRKKLKFKTYKKVRKWSKACAEEFRKRVGFYVSTLFKEM